MGTSPLERDRRPLRVLSQSRMLITAPTYHRARARPRGRTALALGAVLLALMGAGTAGARASTLVIEGAGDGHGVGMSQDGAFGFARHGFTYQAILAHYYTGTTLGQAPPKAIIRVLVGSRVLRVPLERYVRGVVAAEMPSGWPPAALQAQAVASRTYALTSHAGGSRFDVYSDTRSQVYLGVAAETSPTNAAVVDTAGQIVLYHGKPATTYFFASSGGMTENIENSFIDAQPEPWLLGVADPYDNGPSSRWKLAVGFSAVAGELRGLVKGAFRGIEVLRRGVSPRIVSALVLGSAGSTPVNGPELAARLGLSSTWAYFSVRNGAVTRAEPDRSGRPPASAPAPVAGTPPAPPTGPQGGSQAPGSQAGAVAKTGGASAG
ncbi:MAG TPA: SpoIID/LytB domain-containing protein [Solirubrobacteraceae bacterium]|nr:SpoIID/LytB domain-containing protein [Solirubrobacteraceae bacterium]